MRHSSSRAVWMCRDVDAGQEHGYIGAGVGAVGGSVLTGGSTAGTVGGAVVGGVIGHETSKPKK